MSSLELAPLEEHFETSDINALQTALAESDSPELDVAHDLESTLIGGEVEDSILSELFDRLDANDALCDVYVPPDFEGSLRVGNWRVGSAHMLSLTLDEFRDEFGIEDDEDDEPTDHDDEDEELGYDDSEDTEQFPLGDEDAMEYKEGELRRAWKLLSWAARTCIRKGTCLFVQT